MSDERATLGALLRQSRTIAIVGLSPRRDRPSHEVAEYLQEAGYRIVPVRPGGETILGELAYPDLRAAAAAAGPIDIVNIFRRSDAVPALADDLVALHPKLVWMQVGVADEGVRAGLESAGIPVVMNRCLMVDHPWLTST
ncbi:MAG: CoA-binding protein [Gemmatimonadota bacterium]